MVATPRWLPQEMMWSGDPSIPGRTGDPQAAIHQLRPDPVFKREQRPGGALPCAGKGCGICFCILGGTERRKQERQPEGFFQNVYGTDKEVDGVVINDKCKALAQKVKEIIDTKSSFADWLNNQNVRNQLKLEIKICLVKNGYPPQYSPEVFKKVMEQVENFEENN